MKLVIGLGNPGSQYAETRHNIGWMVLDRLADRAGRSGRGRQRDASESVQIRYKGLDLVLAKPLTYMNDSGVAVRKLLARERVPLIDVLVVADDFALPFGKLRFREAGSHGGHNGLRSIIEELESEKFSRLRVGIGEPGRGGDRPRALEIRGRRAGSPADPPGRGGRRRGGVGARRDVQGSEPLQPLRAAGAGRSGRGRCRGAEAGRGWRSGRRDGRAHGRRRAGAGSWAATRATAALPSAVATMAAAMVAAGGDRPVPGADDPGAEARGEGRARVGGTASLRGGRGAAGRPGPSVGGGRGRAA